MEKKTYTIEEVNAFRAEVYRILRSMGETEDDAKAICAVEEMVVAATIGIPEHKASREEAIEVWSDLMQYNTPKELAELMTL